MQPLLVKHNVLQPPFRTDYSGGCSYIENNTRCSRPKFTYNIYLWIVKSFPRSNLTFATCKYKLQIKYKWRIRYTCKHTYVHTYIHTFTHAFFPSRLRGRLPSDLLSPHLACAFREIEALSSIGNRRQVMHRVLNHENLFSLGTFCICLYLQPSHSG